MINCLPAEVFNRISNYIIQNEIIELLIQNGLSDWWDAKFSWNDYWDDEDEDDEDEDEEWDDEEDQEGVVEKEEKQKEEKYIRWTNINKWITFAWIDGFVEMNEIKARKICYINNNLGFWIGVSSIYKDDIIKELIDIIYDYQLSNEEFKALKDWKDIFPKKEVDKK